MAPFFHYVASAPSFHRPLIFEGSSFSIPMTLPTTAGYYQRQPANRATYLMSRILLPNGEPAPDEMLRASDDGAAVLRGISSYASAIAGLSMPTTTRASDPFRNHPWVYAAAFAGALNAAQVPYVIWKETDAQSKVRLKSGDHPKRGKRRSAVRRHLQQSYRKQGYTFRTLEPDYNHPFNDLFTHPNPILTASAQLWLMTNIWFFIRGEAFWLFRDENGDAVTYDSDKAVEVWCVPPDYVQEQIIGGTLTGWWLTPAYGIGLPASMRIHLELDELLQFKNPDPAYPIRGMSPLTSAAAGIDLDMLAVNRNRAVLRNGSDPGGVLSHTGLGAPFKNKEERDNFQKSWEERHQGTDRANRITLLTGGWTYQQIGMTPKDMDFLNQRKWTREEILGVMGIPASVLSITERINFATNLAQDRSFWDKKLIPTLEMYELTLDGTLFFQQPDSVVGGFDLSKVEALKVGLSDKVTIMLNLTDSQIHMPPRIAAETVGLDMPTYDGDDIAMLQPGQITLDTAIAQSKAAKDIAENPPPPPPVMPPGQPGQQPAGGEKLPSGAGQNPKGEPGRSPVGEPRKAGGASTWQRLMKQVQQPYELRFAAAWRRFVGNVRTKQMIRFDAQTKALGLKSFYRTREIGADEVDKMLLQLDELQKDLSFEFNPIYEDQLAATFDATKGELGGPAVFELDSPEIQAALDARQELILGSSPVTLQADMRESVRKGIEAGETVQELRQRVADTLGVAAGSSKALLVARTESAGFMNDAREAMFDAQGFDGREWTTAEDEHVRHDHKIFGTIGPVPIGHNYMKDAGKAGTLEYPGDPRAPASQTINCRCVHIPASSGEKSGRPRLRYSPDQPRDDHGEWTSGGSQPPPASGPDPRVQAAHEWVADINATITEDKAAKVQYLKNIAATANGKYRELREARKTDPAWKAAKDAAGEPGDDAREELVQKAAEADARTAASHAVNSHELPDLTYSRSDFERPNLKQEIEDEVASQLGEYHKTYVEGLHDQSESSQMGQRSDGTISHYLTSKPFATDHQKIIDEMPIPPEHQHFIDQHESRIAEEVQRAESMLVGYGVPKLNGRRIFAKNDNELAPVHPDDIKAFMHAYATHYDSLIPVNATTEFDDLHTARVSREAFKNGLAAVSPQSVKGIKQRRQDIIGEGAPENIGNAHFDYESPEDRAATADLYAKKKLIHNRRSRA